MKLNNNYRAWSIVGLLIALCILCAGNYLNREQSQLADKMIRLHVVANSDTDEDQAFKLQVRDVVLQEVSQILEQAQAEQINPKDAIGGNLDRIYEAAQDFVESNGNGEAVTVSLKKELFPTRDYDTFSLPSGVYTALRVNIGQAQGHNWWCVVFPNLCMTASMEELEDAASVAGLSDGEVRLITEESEGYVLKFKSIEILQSIKNYFG